MPPKKFNPSQLRSKLRQIENQQKQAVRKANSAINKYNQEVRTYNSRRRSQQARLERELSRLRQPRTTTTVRFTVRQQSTITLHQRYELLEQNVTTEHLGEDEAALLDLSENEVANDMQLVNLLLMDSGNNEVSEDAQVEQDLRATVVTSELRQLSDDLDSRWRGALFALSPRNPDATRQFCASTRELFAQMLDTAAPNAVVITANPTCARTPNGTPTRRAKIEYLLRHNGRQSASLEAFVEQDIDNIVTIFNDLNSGTHGTANKFAIPTLQAIKKRAEDGILFLSRIISLQIA